MYLNECKALQDEIVKMRRELHTFPELGTNLPQTHAYVKAKLDELGVSYVESTKDSSFIATIGGKKPGKTVALRADMDALPITENTGVEYASKNAGCMHACGHDSHTSMLIATAKVLKAHEDELNGTVKLLFQTGEEIAKGAPILIEEGALDGVDAIFGTHVGTLMGPDIPAGTIVCKPGPIMASFDRFIINVKGVGCHGSTPELGVDPINIASHIVIALQTIHAREICTHTPNVLTIGKIAGGAQYNVIPGEVVIEGTTRALSEEIRHYLAKRIAEIASATAAVFGGTAETTMDWGAPAVINSEGYDAYIENAAKKCFGDNMYKVMNKPLMGGEDFAAYLLKIPGAFFFLSTSNKEKDAAYPHHNPKFNIDEDVLWHGPAMFCELVDEYLNK